MGSLPAENTAPVFTPQPDSLASKILFLIAGLVAGVVLAIVILLLLLSFAVFDSHHASLPPGYLDKLMQDQLKTQVANSYGCSAPYRGTIKRGTTIFAKGVAGTILELEGGDKFTFDVDSSATTGVVGVAGVGPYTVAEAKLTTTGMTSSEAPAFFVVCANTHATPNVVRVCVAGKDSSAVITGCKPD